MNHDWLTVIHCVQKKTATVVFLHNSYIYGDTTQLNSTSSCRHVHSVNNRHLSMNVVTQLTQFVGREVIKTRLTWLNAVQLGQLS